VVEELKPLKGIENMKKPWRKLNSRIVYKNPYWCAREDRVIQPDGQKGIYYVVDKRPFALVIPMTESWEIFLIRHWRYIANKNSWEFPAGGCDDNETLRQSALRELKEETGIVPKRLIKIGAGMTSNGFTNDSYQIFLARGLRWGKRNLDTTESDMIFKKFTISQVEKMVASGEIHDVPTIAALYILKLYLKGKNEDSPLRKGLSSDR
jgi:ADP-ribose pyrophosphatase